MNREMKEIEKILKDENCFFKSQIEGLPDVLWSMGARTIYPPGEALIKWFHSPVPAFGNRTPMDILREDGEYALYKEMITIPC